MNETASSRGQLDAYRASDSEQLRCADLARWVPEAGETALDVGARDGFYSRMLADRFAEVTALDLSLPDVGDARVRCVQGDVCALEFEDDAFDFVFCAEVLEHIPPARLPLACSELARVCCGELLIGVPYRQDIRVGRTTCAACGRTNPPWGHVNRFDEARLAGLFPQCEVRDVSYVGTTNESTNVIAALLMDWAGNPYGTYEQDEPCIHCNGSIGEPAPRSFGRKVLTRIGFAARAVSRWYDAPHAQWMHVRMSHRR